VSHTLDQINLYEHAQVLDIMCFVTNRTMAHMIKDVLNCIVLHCFPPIPFHAITLLDRSRPSNLGVPTEQAKNHAEAAMSMRSTPCCGSLAGPSLELVKKTTCNQAQIPVCLCCSSRFCAGAHLRSKTNTLNHFTQTWSV
jgi:hypothetical protein